MSCLACNLTNMEIDWFRNFKKGLIGATYNNLIFHKPQLVDFWLKIRLRYTNLS